MRGSQQDVIRGHDPSPPPIRSHRRTLLVGGLVVLGSLGIWIGSASRELSSLQWSVIAVGLLAATGAVLLTRRRVEVLGWFGAAVALAALRILNG